ncbi:MAG: GMC family oxidoreductase [Acidimicrobiia bacterium]|nr:GMC family oxidoreductase [Acidimicrobiia bacterium]
MQTHDYDVLIVGSGFGGSVAALRAAEKGYRVGVLEAGRRWTAETFPKTSWDLRRFFWFPRLGMRGIQRLSLLRDVLVLSGAGVGGGSLVWANTSYRPHERFFDDPQWSDVTDWRQELGPFYDLAERMLGVVPNPTTTESDRVLQKVAAHFGVESTYRATPVAVHFGEADVTVPDPYFGGAGPARAGCRECGGCMVGCRHNAKNSLDRNYLYLAEGLGADILADHEVTDVRPRPGGGFEVTWRSPGKTSRGTLSAGDVVFAAGALGTSKLLVTLKEGSLPGLSGRVGHQFRTNSEVIVGAAAPDGRVDYSHGVAITSSIHPEPHTHIEVVRYPAGSNSMGLLTTVLTDGGPGMPRWLRWVAAGVRQPFTFLKSMSVRKWSERTVILLVMQSLDNSLQIARRKGRFGPRFTTTPDGGKPAPTYVPIANEAARVAAAAMGGYPGSTINEAVLDVPMTAHILGGAPVGATPERGVVDGYHRVFGYPNLHVVDGAAVGANLGVNPSLTITAMAERAMSLWPNKGETDQRADQSVGYVPVDVVRPNRPAVPDDAPAALR